jgi:hypothetical protein
MSKASRLRRAHRKKRRPIKVLPTRSLGSRRLMKRMSRDHPDLLQNIEFVLVTDWRENHQVDDAAAEEALRTVLGEGTPRSPLAEGIVEHLAAMREFRSDIPDHIWRDAVLTVLQSVRRHSLRRPGEQAYLRFASPFIL